MASGPTVTPADHAIATLAARQYDVVARRQLREAGVSDKMVRSRVQRAQLVRLHPGVYAAAHAHLRPRGTWLAAVLAVGAPAVLSHRAAAALHGIRQWHGGGVDVTTAARVRSTLPGVRVHRTRRMDPPEFADVDGIPVTTPARTLVDLAAVLPADRLARAFREADRLRLLDLRAVRDAADRARARPGAGHATLRTVLDELEAVGATAHSPLEDGFLRVVAHARLPAPQVNVWLEGIEVDAYWAGAKVVVQVDGWAFHRSRHAFQRDREKDAALVAAGLRVVRFTHHDVTRRSEAVVRTLRTLLATEPNH